tara:strand:+ start:273 stop:1331 length:1059 start_codon:yes stop_codon:yes gene_type:complete
MFKISLISCGRSDYNIYLPLIKKIQQTPNIKLDVIVAGTHMLLEYGNTIELFIKDNIEITYKVNTISNDDSSKGITLSMADTITEFTKIWEQTNYDLVFVLGDRYEMFAAASSTIPFNIPLAHIHGGETTLGAIDNKFRHAITAISKYHFTSNEQHKQRVIDIVGNKENVYNVGALALEFINELNITPTYSNNILFCYHPETINLTNEEYINEICDAIELIDSTFTILLPNNDTDNNIIRNTIKHRLKGSKYKIIKTLPHIDYYTELASCKYMLGNSSSGIYEAASFKKYAINIGDRQKGRISGENVLHCKADKYEILKVCNNTIGHYSKNNIYHKFNTSNKIIEVINKLYV